MAAHAKEILASGNYTPEAERGLKHSLALSNDYIREIKNCLSDPSNLISGEPNVGMYIALGIGIAAGIGGLAWYLKSRSKKSEKASR